MKKFLLYLGLSIGIGLISFSANADSSVQLTDADSVLDLTRPQNKIDLLECGMWVAQVNGKYFLRNIKGVSIPISSQSIKTIQDKVMVDVALNAKLFGYQVDMMNVVFERQGERVRWGATAIWSAEKKMHVYYSQRTSFLIDANQQQLTDAIQAAMITKLKGFLLNVYPPEKSYQHLVMELSALKELTEGAGGATLRWALLVRGISKDVLSAAFSHPIDLPDVPGVQYLSPSQIEKIAIVKPKLTEVSYTCLIDGGVTP